MGLLQNPTFLSKTASGKGPVASSGLGTKLWESNGFFSFLFFAAAMNRFPLSLLPWAKSFFWKGNTVENNTLWEINLSPWEGRREGARGIVGEIEEEAEEEEEDDEAMRVASMVVEMEECSGKGVTIRRSE